MSAKTVFSAALVLAVLGFCSARAQPPSMPNTMGYNGSSNNNNNSDADNDERKPTPTGEGPHSLSHYITYQRTDCCGPIGGNGPVQLELYSRAGVSLIGSDTSFAKALQDGWLVEAGGRSLFYNPAMDAAWTVDFGLTNIWNHGQRPDISFGLKNLVVPFGPAPNPFSNFSTFAIGSFNPNAKTTTITTVVPSAPSPVAGQTVPVFTAPGVTIRNFNRTFVDLTFGREWYLMGSAHDAGTKWRAGIDVGGRYGSADLQLNEIRHRTSVLEGALIALHTDVEIPCCAVVFLAGFRTEWSYTFCDILQEQNNTDLMDVNVLLTAGVRF